MLLKDFIEYQKSELEKFEKLWLEQNKIQPKNHPLSMEDWDWFEQFLIFNPVNAQTEREKS